MKQLIFWNIFWRENSNNLKSTSSGPIFSKPRHFVRPGGSSLLCAKPNLKKPARAFVGIPTCFSYHLIACGTCSFGIFLTQSVQYWLPSSEIWARKNSSDGRTDPFFPWSALKPFSEKKCRHPNEPIKIKHLNICAAETAAWEELKACAIPCQRNKWVS